jgi:hypothetical protein
LLCHACLISIRGGINKLENYIYIKNTYKERELPRIVSFIYPMGGRSLFLGLACVAVIERNLRIIIIGLQIIKSFL